MSSCHTDGPLFFPPVNSWLERDPQCLHTPLVCTFISLSLPVSAHLSALLVFRPHRDLAHFLALSPSYLCLHLASFLWNLSAFSQMVLSTPLLYTRLSITLFSCHLCPPPFFFPSSVLFHLVSFSPGVSPSGSLWRIKSPPSREEPSRT